MIEKLNSGLLRVFTPLGPRYLKPSFLQRLYLIWIFRNFESLPAKVLTSRQQRIIASMWSQNRFVASPQSHGVYDAAVIGTLEQRPDREGLTDATGRENMVEAVSPYATD
ncbi:MAG: hypothetical protein M3O09_05305 [Acidobacteriota bacterium]|nr:hypothetical protein [Acidobacteriota bacterium]